MINLSIKSTNGFTITELCVVLLITSLGFATFLSASRTSRRYELKNFLFNVERTIQLASTIASNSGDRCEIVISKELKQINTTCSNSALTPKPLAIPRSTVINASFGGTDSNLLTTHENGIFTPGSIVAQRESTSCKLSLSLYGARSISCS